MDQSRIINSFIETYQRLKKNHLTEGKVDDGCYEEIVLINVGIALSTTICELIKEEHTNESIQRLR